MPSTNHMNIITYGHHKADKIICGLTIVLAFSSYLRTIKTIRSEKLTKAAIEVLSIVAYRQPITRGEIAEIRGVRSDYLINTLMRKDLIKECGKKDALGHPALFSTTEIFLRDFNLKDISQLPRLDVFEELDPMELLEEEMYPEEPEVPIE